MVRRITAVEGPDPIDVHVGLQLRRRMTTLAMTYEQLAERIGCSYQQVQKYRTARNRLSAANLHRVAQALGVPITYFFEGSAEPTVLDGANDHITREAIRVFRDMDAVGASMLLGALKRLASKANATDIQGAPV